MRIGEVQIKAKGDAFGFFKTEELKQYIREHGHLQLADALTYMSWQLHDAVKEVNKERYPESISVQNTKR